MKPSEELAGDSPDETDSRLAMGRHHDHSAAAAAHNASNRRQSSSVLFSMMILLSVLFLFLSSSSPSTTSTTAMAQDNPDSPDTPELMDDGEREYHRSLRLGLQCRWQLDDTYHTHKAPVGLPERLLLLVHELGTVPTLPTGHRVRLGVLLPSADPDQSIVYVALRCFDLEITSRTP